MELANPRADRISDHIQHRESAKTGRKEVFVIDGIRREMDVFHLPLNFFVYSLRNGRFAAELRELEVTEGRRLNPEKEKDSEKIEELLLHDSIKMEWLKRDIIRVGQLKAATITYDGYIINGNRRQAVLKRLLKETGEQRFAFIDAVILPKTVSASDLWRFEAGFQLAQELKADYGPVNELLKIKEGKEYGLPHQEIALILGGNNTVDDVLTKLRILELIEDFLIYFGQEGRYSIIEQKTEHFIDLVKMMKKSSWKKLDTDIQNQILHAAYHLIHDGTAHLMIRRFNDIVNNPLLALEFYNKTSSLTQDETEIKTSSNILSSNQQTDEDLQLLASKLTESTSEKEKTPPKKVKTNVDTESTQKTLPSHKNREKLKEIFQATIEKADLVKQKKKPAQIIERIENNLEALNEVPVEHLKQFIEDFTRIENLMKKVSLRFR